MNKKFLSTRKSGFTFFLVLFIAVIIVLGAYRAVTGQSLGLRSWVDLQMYSIKSNFLAILDSKHVKNLNNGEFSNIIFVHHSVGRNLITVGNLRELLANEDLKLSDQDYNYNGLTDPDGKKKGYSILVPNDNTDPDGLAHIFSQTTLPLPINTISALQQYEVIIIKSCFPASAIRSAQQVQTYKTNYLKIRNTADQHRGQLIILLTSPPLQPSETSPEEAARARQIAEWLSAPEFIQGHPNLVVFDFYNLLAGNDPASADFNMLKQEYQNGIDSHPNEKANKDVGPVLADFIKISTDQYRSIFPSLSK